MFATNYFSQLTGVNPSPLVSIVIPTFMEQEYIVKTLESLSEQTVWDRAEVVIADYDPDGTRQTVTSVQNLMSKNPLRYNGKVMLVDVGRKGIGFARAVGTTAARAPFINTFDADCIYNRPDAIELLLQPLFKGEALFTHCENILDDKDEKEKAIELAKTLFNMRNAMLNFLPWMFEQGLTFAKTTYDMVGGWSDVTAGESAFLEFAAISKFGGWGKFRIVRDVHVIVSPRRMGTIDLDYNNAWRNGKSIRVR